MNKQSVLGIIPARMGSSRLYGKPLADIAGVSMVERVYRQAQKSPSLSDLVVATDHPAIQEHVLSFGGKAVLTSAEHRNGTERCAEVLDKLDDNYNLIVNIQGDEPFVSPDELNLLVRLMRDRNAQIGSLFRKESDFLELGKASCVKVALDFNSRAMYFSRSLIPHYRDQDSVTQVYFKHIGIYAFCPRTLRELVKLKETPLERAEQLEQLRWLENGYTIYMAETEADTLSVDTPEDLEKARIFAQSNLL